MKRLYALGLGVLCSMYSCDNLQMSSSLTTTIGSHERTLKYESAHRDSLEKALVKHNCPTHFKKIEKARRKCDSLEKRIDSLKSNYSKK